MASFPQTAIIETANLVSSSPLERHFPRCHIPTKLLKCDIRLKWWLKQTLHQSIVFVCNIRFLDYCFAYIYKFPFFWAFSLWYIKYTETLTKLNFWNKLLRKEMNICNALYCHTFDKVWHNMRQLDSMQCDKIPPASIAFHLSTKA